VALALKAGRPTILLAASREAVAFFRSLTDGALLLEADTPEVAMDLIAQQLATARDGAKG
jgi:hypothetical protein